MEDGRAPAKTEPGTRWWLNFTTPQGLFAVAAVIGAIATLINALH